MKRQPSPAAAERARQKQYQLVGIQEAERLRLAAPVPRGEYEQTIKELQEQISKLRLAVVSLGKHRHLACGGTVIG